MASGAAITETITERQENEVELLQAIFLQDFKDLREKDVWKVPRPPELQITLFPVRETSQRVEFYVQVDLIVKCSSNYPESLPEISLENAKGLSHSYLATLKQKLENEAEKLKGEVMIFELAQHVQNFLSEHNQPSPGSFYEEMLSNKRKQQEDLERQIQLQKEIELRRIEKEMTRRKEEFRMDAKLKRSRSLSIGNSENLSTISPCTAGLSPIPVSTTNIEESPISRHLPEIKPILLKNRFTSTPLVKFSPMKTSCQLCMQGRTTRLSFKSSEKLNSKSDIIIQKGKCLGHGPNGTVVYAGMDTSNGELRAIEEWCINIKTSGLKNSIDDRKESLNVADNLSKQLTAVEQELVSLLKLHHPNLVHYYALRQQQEKENLLIQVLKDYINGHSLSTHLSGRPVPLDLLVNYTSEILHALNYLHQHAVVHKNLRASSIFIDRDGRVRVGDYSLDKRLSDIYTSIMSKDKMQGITISANREGKADDVFKLGLLVLSLVKGQDVVDPFVNIPLNLPLALRDFLDKCLISNEQKRWNVDDLLEHAFLKNELKLVPIIGLEEVPQPELIDVNYSSQSSQGNLLNLPASCRQSRVLTEFEILKEIGKGSFGNVLKVHNKLDGGIYALKRICLDPRSIQLNRKIFREVKLLSRLNHENVVRYFNSWIETGTILSDDSSSDNSGFEKENITPNKKSNRLNSSNDVEKNAPKQIDTSIEWSVSYDADAQTVEVEDDSASEDENTVFGADFFPDVDSDDDSVIFEDSRNSTESTAELLKTKLDDKDDELNETCKFTKMVQYMYIQMEYCDKSTLFTCIRDDNLYIDQPRLWRLFRGIVEGLSHIHKQGMIHRDLKPANIFLDSSDRVKIGDFGLATTQFIGRSMLSENSQSLLEKYPDLSCSDLISDESRTGKVGTFLYASPELENASSRKTYNQKVDIYSMGIIFFEMCYPSLPTNMERAKVLSLLRTEKIIFPKDFDLDSPQAHIIRWLLNHDAIKRPTSSELLSHLPLEMEEAKQMDVIQTTVKNTQSKMHKSLIASLLSQKMTGIADDTYDIDLYKGCLSIKSICLQNYILEILTKIFLNHGAIKISSPMLMPRGYHSENHKLSVHVMNNDGGIVTLPYNLRTPFARFIAKSNLNNLKRFSIDRVFRERKIYGCHPRELIEAAFDIVTPNPGGLWADAEVLAVVDDVINHFPALKAVDYYIRLNHVALLKAAFNLCDIPEEKYSEVYKVLTDIALDRLSKNQLQSRLSSYSVPEHKTFQFLKCMEIQGPINKVSNLLLQLVKKKKNALSLAKEGLYELETVIRNAEYFGVRCPMIVSLNMAYNGSHFSGMICQVVSENKKRRRKGALDVLASGGRYDKLVSHFKPSGSLVSQSAVGVSISVEKIYALLEQDEVVIPSSVAVLVVSLLPEDLIKPKLQAVQSLWAAGISADVISEPLQKTDDLEDLSRERNVNCIVIASDAENLIIKTFNTEHEKLSEKKVTVQDLGENVQQIMNSSNKSESVANSLSSSFKNCSSNISNTSDSNNSSSNCPISMVNISFNSGEKLTSISKRKYEQQIMSRLTSIIPQFSNKVTIEVIAVELSNQVLKTVIAYLEMESEETFHQSITTVIEKHQRYRKYLNKIFDQIHELAFQRKQRNPIILYSYKDDVYKLLF